MQDETYPLSGSDLQAMHALLARPGLQECVVDFEEQIQLTAFRETLRLWRAAGELAAFAYVDDYNNLWFAADEKTPAIDRLEDEIVAHALQVIRERNARHGSRDPLDFSCRSDETRRLRLMERHGFQVQPVRTLQFSRDLRAPIPDFPLPAGYTLRPTWGEVEIEALVELHRAAFGTDQMTVEWRRAIMNAPQYVPDLDLLAVAPDGELAAFCVCGFDDPERRVGYTDPIGTHARHQGKGLGRALLSAGLQALQAAGAVRAELGTSSENQAMVKLASALGFELASEKLWFSKDVD
jgi:ribosomal protein S18 acetylase RimI-like enzyme